MATGSLMKSRIAIGDVLELVTRRGFAYAQVINEHPLYGWLVRLLAGVYPTRQELTTLVALPTSFIAFVGVEAGLRDRVFRMIGSATVPSEHRVLPRFKWAFPAPTARDLDWWIWDPLTAGPGMNRTHVGRDLSPDQRRMPVEQVVSPSIFVAQIDSDWTPEDAQVRSGWESLRTTEADVGSVGTCHKLAFPSRDLVEAAANEARAMSPGAEVRIESDSDDLSIFDAKPPTDERINDLEKLASRHGGDYVGRETLIGNVKQRA